MLQWQDISLKYIALSRKPWPHSQVGKLSGQACGGRQGWSRFTEQ